MRRNALPSAWGMSPLRNSGSLSSSFACMASQLLKSARVQSGTRQLQGCSSSSQQGLMQQAQELSITAAFSP